jgi:hypothetical protein
MVPPTAVVQTFGVPVTGVPAIVEAAVSVVVKPVPVTYIDAPTGPEEGDGVTTCGRTVSVVEASADSTTGSLTATV